MEMSELLHHYKSCDVLHKFFLIVVNIYTGQREIQSDVIIYVITRLAHVFMKQTVGDFVLRMDLIVLLHMDHMT